MGINLKPYFKLLRIEDWRGYFLVALFGFLISKGFLFPLWQIIIFWTIVLLLLAFGFSVNDCFDTKEDRYHPQKENVLVSKKITFPKGLTFSLALGILALALSLFFGLKIFLFVFLSALLGFFYSAPPIRFKSRPFLDLISHGFFAGTLIFFFPLLIFQREITPLHLLIGFSIFYFSVIAEMRNHLEDYLTDKKAGLKTAVLILKYEFSKIILIFFALFSPLILLPIFLFTSLKFSLSFLMFTLIFLLFFLLRGNYKRLENYKIMDTYVFFSFCLLLIYFLGK